MSNKWKLFWVGAFAFVVLFQACGMHSWQELLISTDDEKKLGKEYDSLIRVGDKSVMEAGESIFTPKTSADTVLYNYYQDLKTKMVGAISDDEWAAVLPSGYTKNNFFEFKIINSKQVNAFAVPGGYVYFYTAILKNFQSESELLSVMSHEIGHVIKHHSRESMVKQGIMGVVIDALLGDGLGATVASLGTSVWLLSGSRENELEADEMGYIYTKKIGVSSKGLGDFFARGLETDESGENCKSGSSILDVFSTHPPSCERIKKNYARYKNDGLPMYMPTSKYQSNAEFTAMVKAAGI